MSKNKMSRTSVISTHEGAFKISLTNVVEAAFEAGLLDGVQVTKQFLAKVARKGQKVSSENRCQVKPESPVTELLDKLSGSKVFHVECAGLGTRVFNETGALQAMKRARASWDAKVKDIWGDNLGAAEDEGCTIDMKHVKTLADYMSYLSENNGLGLEIPR
jgi:hypothetical protein